MTLPRPRLKPIAMTLKMRWSPCVAKCCDSWNSLRYNRFRGGKITRTPIRRLPIAAKILRFRPMPKTSPSASAAPIPVKAPAKGDHVFLVDGSSYIFRAYHALPPLNRKSDGLQVNAVLGFCNMLWKLLREMPPDNRPTHLAIVFDKSEITFRNKIYPEYKAHRPP